MKTLYLLASLIFISNSFFAQRAIMPAHTIAAIRTIDKTYQHTRNTPSDHLLNFYPIYKENGQFRIAALAKINSSFNKADAIRDGFDVGAIVGNIASMRMPLHLLREDFSYPGIEYIEVAEKIEPELDKALSDIRADLVHKGVDLPQAYTGKDVIIGVVDWGFDYSHPMFYDTSLSYTRILAAWDQEKRIGTPPPGFSHGAYYNDVFQLAAAQSDTFSVLTDYHGSHVAGIAGGSGGGTAYRGVGIESEFLFSQMRRDLTSSMDAFQWMVNEAQAAGKRLVINNSWGGYRTQPLDGTSLLSQAIDAFTEQGVVFVFSGGNNGDINFHLRKTFNEDSVRTRIMGFNYNSDNDLWGQTVTMWGEPGHPFSFKLRILSSTNALLAESELITTSSAPPLVDTFLIIGPDTVFYSFITDASHPLNGRPQMTLNIRSLNTTLRSTLLATAPSGTVHFWNTRLTNYGGGNWGYGFTAPTTGYVNGDRNYGVGHPAITTNVITVAAHETNKHLTDFSSYGPRMDEMLKPEISAPGQDIISSFNSYSTEGFTAVTTVNFNGRTYKFIRLSGTSMSAPMVTGAIALLLEANPTLTTSEVKQILLENTRTDNFTGDIAPAGSVRWGHGKLDIQQAIQTMLNVGTEEVAAGNNMLFPNPTKDIVYIDRELKGNESFCMYDMKGEIVSQGKFDGSISLANFIDGMYVLSIEGDGGVEMYKVVVSGE